MMMSRAIKPTTTPRSVSKAATTCGESHAPDPIATLAAVVEFSIATFIRVSWLLCPAMIEHGGVKPQAQRLFALPYFLRSTTRGSRVRKPSRLQFRGAMCRLLRRMYMADFPQKSGPYKGRTESSFRLRCRFGLQKV